MLTMEIQKKMLKDTAVLELVGEFDLNEVELFEEAFSTCIEDVACHRIVLDMDQLTFLGSSGISALIGMGRRLEGKKDGVIYIYRANDYIVDLVRMTGIEPIVKLIDGWELQRLSGVEVAG